MIIKLILLLYNSLASSQGHPSFQRYMRKGEGPGIRSHMTDFVHMKGLGGWAKEVGSAVTSRALYCAAFALGMIGILITSFCLACHRILDKILRWLEVLYYTTATTVKPDTCT